MKEVIENGYLARRGFVILQKKITGDAANDGSCKDTNFCLVKIEVIGKGQRCNKQ